MKSNFQKRTDGRRGFTSATADSRLLVLLCLVLVALLMFVQVGHTHAFNTDADHCPVCVVMHSAAPVAVVATVLIAVRASFTQRLAVVRPRASIWRYELFNRPPPHN